METRHSGSNFGPSGSSFVGLAVLCLLSGAVLLSDCWSHPMQAEGFTREKETRQIYTDALESGWENWSWGVTLDFNNANPVHQGSASIALTYDQAWAGMYLAASAVIPGSDDQALQFQIHGSAAGGHELIVMLVDEDHNLMTSYVAVTTQAGAWTEVTIPISDLGMPDGISGIVWQDTSGGAQSTFYIDAICMVVVKQRKPVENIVPCKAGPNLFINGGAPLHPINPDIYGMNHADEFLAAELNLPVRRWGGNATTRYNWQNDTSNRASDWFFENIPNENSHPELLPDGSRADRFVEQNMATGTESLITLPLLGWTPKARQFDCGFRVSKYGAQQETDPWQPDAGNGIAPDGTPITGNDPLDTSAAIGPAFVQDWIAHLTNKYGTAGAGGVKYYNLDNEPMLWNSTHRDVHSQATSYDDMRDLTYLYGAAVKAADPGALTLGPALWGWTAYFYSALDSEPGGSWWLNPLDRLAHGNVPFTDWYLQQMRAYEQTHGTRILDYLDLHGYPQATGVALSDAGDAATQALRLRSTRNLWDPAYVDESWIDEPVRLIPRMHDWVKQNYPGTKLAITEYNWGAFDHMSGALAQADVLGIFGRERLDLAALWGEPGFDDPLAFAFRIYRNYDGLGSAFGNRTVSCASGDQGLLSVYGALRDKDGALTLVVINKTGKHRKSQVTLSNFTPLGMAEVYQYSAADLGAIKRQVDFQIKTKKFWYTFPPESITLIVLR